MNVLKFLILITWSTPFFCRAQNDSPYHTSFKADAPITATGIGLSALGLHLIKNKAGLTTTQLAALSKDNVNGFDRFSAGYYSENASKVSNIPFYGSFALPFVVLLNDKVNNRAGQVMALYVETMSVTGTLYTMAAGNVSRNRPYTYGTEASLEDRTKSGATRSFFAGHVAATASATFFAAKVFSDFNPGSQLKPYVWATAATLPAAVAYLRLKSGMHFLSDNLLGYAIGSTVGIMVPQLHKGKSAANLSIVPVYQPGYQAVAASYTFK